MARSAACLTVLLSLNLMGCAHSSLLQGQASCTTPQRTLPLSVTLGSIEDKITCDDEALYLRDFIREHRSFIDWELASATSLPAADSDLVIEGEIDLSTSSHSFGLGQFLAVITCGVYYLAGGPTQRHTASINYRFHVRDTTSATVRDHAFSDHRDAYGGLYGPRIDVNRKPGVYDAGWAELIRLISEDRQSKGAP